MELQFSGNGVEAAWMPRMATQDALHRKPAAAKRTVFENRAPCILRAGRRKPTGRRKKGRQEKLVQPDQTEEQSRHRAIAESSSIISGRRSGMTRRFQGDRRRTTMSRPAMRCCAARKYSRTQRFRQFRSTARAANRRPITIPSLARPSPLGRANISKQSPAATVGERKSARNDRDPLSLSLRGKPFCVSAFKRQGERGLWRDAH